MTQHDPHPARHLGVRNTAPVREGRFVADPQGDVAVFLIGMRINQPLKVAKWLPVARAMPPMLTKLGDDPESGFLGCHTWFGRTIIVLSYWRHADDIIRFASDPASPHLEAWRAFQRKVGTSGTVGIWHETYTVRQGEREAIYVNMPPFGLGRAIGDVPVSGGLATARQRLRAGAEGAQLPRTS